MCDEDEGQGSVILFMAGLAGPPVSVSGCDLCRSNQGPAMLPNYLLIIHSQLLRCDQTKLLFLSVQTSLTASLVLRYHNISCGTI